jgi:protein-S-isoprenylcysteine O-methyltransferase Ste14
MFCYLVPLLLGFIFNCASAFTSFYSHRFGARGGKLVSIVLRDVLGIPVWAFGYGLAVLSESAELFKPSLISSMLAWVLILAGAAIIITGLVSLRWRAAAPSIQDTLVAQGLYGHIRHPLYSGMILELTGLFLYIPTLSVLVASILGVVWVMVQARLEEMDLMGRLPAYKDYMQRVPRFVPRLRQ